MLNRIEKLYNRYRRDKSGLDELNEAIETYVAHVKEHFAGEEQLMQAYDFPEYEMHKLAHDAFLADLNLTYKGFKEGELERMIRFLFGVPEWLVMHVNTVDAPTAAYLAHKVQNR